MMTKPAQEQLPQYQHFGKVVITLRIVTVTDPTATGAESDGSRMLTFQSGPPIRVYDEYVRMYKPEAGGEYVLYTHGVESYIPPKAFEEATPGSDG